MELKKYFLKKGRGTAAALAKQINAPWSDVSNWAGGVRPVPIHRAVAIEQATGGQVTRRDLRPDDWWLIWPELRSLYTAKGIPAPAVHNDGAAGKEVVHG